jgi:hypothetical protein
MRQNSDMVLLHQPANTAAPEAAPAWSGSCLAVCHAAASQVRLTAQQNLATACQHNYNTRRNCGAQIHTSLPRLQLLLWLFARMMTVRNRKSKSPHQTSPCLHATLQIMPAAAQAALQGAPRVSQDRKALQQAVQGQQATAMPLKQGAALLHTQCTHTALAMLDPTAAQLRLASSCRSCNQVMMCSS